MGKALGISGTGTGSIGGGSGPAAPGNVSAITVTGFIDPISGTFTLIVGVTPPSPLGTFIGVHLYLEIPDQSASGSFTVGSSTLGSAPVTGNWNPLDLGDFSYVAAQQPWAVSGPAPVTVDATKNIACRLYAVSISTNGENQLVRHGAPGETPNQTFTLISLASGSPTAGTNVTAVAGPIVATVEPPVNVGGKLKTPILVDLSTVPNNIKGWSYRLVVTYGTADPTKTANQFVVSALFTQAGPVPAPADGISEPHSFALDTPTSVQQAIVWCQSGLVDSGGNFQANNIVPGITPEFPITYGTTTGTTDATSVMLATINSSMAIISNAFGVAVPGISNANLQALCVASANLASSSVTATKIANLAVGNAAIANLAVDNTKIINATILGANIAFGTIAGANIGTATIAQANIANLAVGTAQLQDLSVTDAKISSLSAGKITAGTISAVTISALTCNGGAISGTTLTLTVGNVTTTVGTGAVFSDSYGLSVSNTVLTASVVAENSTSGNAGFYIRSALSLDSVILAYNPTSQDAVLEMQTGGNVLNISFLAGVGYLKIPGLQTSAGAGGGAFWYDPADSNRVKYAP
jgi:hypothetical protein